MGGVRGMEFRTVGGAGGGGLRVSLVGLGCNNFGRRLGERESRAVIHAALDAGITLFDTADSYGGGRSEKFIGKALGARRREIAIATKFGWSGGAGPRKVARAVEGSLKRLRTDVIDLYQIHRPDPATPIADTLEALDRLVDQGKVRFVGCSNFSGAQIAEARAVADAHGRRAFVTAQNPYSLLDRAIEDDVVPACAPGAMGILPYYPLANGLLSGKYRRGAPWPGGTRLSQWRVSDLEWEVVEGLAAHAEAAGRSLLELAFSWLAARPGILSVIAGATTPEQVARNAGAAGWRLTEADLAEVGRFAPPY